MERKPNSEMVSDSLEKKEAEEQDEWGVKTEKVQLETGVYLMFMITFFK